VVFGSVLKGYGRARQMERVWAVFKEMLSRNITPSVITYNAVIDACARNGQTDRIPQLLEDMKKQGLEANLITYSTMIKGSCQQGDMQSALATLETLRKAPRFKPDEIVYNTLLDGCAQAGLVSEGERIFTEMQAEGVQPGAYTLAVLVRLLAHGRRVDRAFELVESMGRKYRLRPNSHVYGALIQACLQTRDLTRAVSVFEQAAKDRVQVEGKACMGLIRSLVSAGNQTKAVSILRATMGMTRKPERNAGGGGSDRNAGGPVLEDSFVCEIISGLATNGTGTLAATLLTDFKAARPRARIDTAVERKVAMAMAAAKR